MKRAILIVALVLAMVALVVWFNRQRFLVHAARRGDVRILQGLLAIGADPNAGPTGTTPLYAAVWYGRRETAACLLIRGAGVNAADTSGFTPLHAAAAHGDNAMVRLLLDHGADIKARAACGTALEVARANHHTSTADLLEAAGTTPSGKTDQ